MLEWTAAGPGPRFALIVHHADAEREWAYDRQSHIGKLDKAWDEATTKGWTVVSMKDDWAAIYPRMEFTYDGDGMGKGAIITLYVDGKKVGEGRVGRTHALFFSMDETLEIGCDLGEPVSEEYGSRDNAFTGKVKWVQIDIDAAAKDVDHMVGAEERFQLAVARQ